MANPTANKVIFQTTVLEAGKSILGIEVPTEVIEKLGGGKKPLVVVTVNGFTWRSAVAVMGGKFMTGINAENRIGANVKGGDQIEVTLELDTKPREVEIPAEIAALFQKNATAKAFFQSLSTTKKKALTVPIFEAKTEETKQKRVEKAIDMLLEHKTI